MQESKAETIDRAAALAAVLTEGALEIGGRRIAGPSTIAAAVAKLIKIADGLTRRAERECNEVMDEQAHARKDRADARAYDEATAIVAPYGETIAKMGDVRGYAIKIALPTGRTNSMGREGWGGVT